MTESKKAILGLVIFLAALAALFLSAPGLRAAIGYGFLPSAASLLVAAASAVGIWKLNAKADLAPDFLARLSGKYFDGGGFCFHLVPFPKEFPRGVRVYFQNRYQNPCDASIAFRPMGVFTHGVPEFCAKVACQGGAFGFVEIHWPVPSKAAGKSIRLRAFAEAVYPDGKGKELRHRSGIFVSTAPSLLGQIKRFGIGGTYAFLKFRIPEQLPDAVFEARPEPNAHTLWTLSDPVPENPEVPAPCLS